MIRFKSVTLRNFLSYGNNTTIVNLERPGTTLIQGEDLDNTTHGKSANGVGKTTIINAICFAGYNKTISKFSVDELINDVNKKEMEVTIEWVAADGTEYRVHRFRKMKAPLGNGVKFYINGEDKTRVGPEMQKDIEDAIGMPFDIFVRMVIFSARHQPFLELPSSSTTAVNQRDILEELFCLTELTAKAETVKVRIKQTETDLKMKAATAQQAQNEVDRHATQLKSAAKRVDDWYDSTEAQIAALAVRLKKAKAIDFKAQQALLDEITELSKQTAPLDRMDNALQQIMRDAKKVMTAKAAEHKHLDDSTCPYCKQDFKGSAEKKIEVDQELQEATTKYNEAAFDLAEVKKEVRAIEAQQTALMAKLAVNTSAELARLEADSQNLMARIEELSVEENPHESALAELQKLEIEEVDYAEINRLEKVLEHQKFLLKLLTKSDSFVRKTLLNTNLPYLNKKLRESLSELGLPHTVEFQPDMSAKILRRGVEIGFHQLSAGQAARINFALALAFTDVRQRLHGKVNICLFDEVLDSGLDTVGVQLAAKLIKHRAREQNTSTFVISHREEASNMFDSKLTVQMSQGFSTIKDESMVE